MGIEQVEQLPGSAAAKLRLEVLLANLAGELNVEQACVALGLHKSRFFELRKRWLQESVEVLEPEPAGRPMGTGHSGTGREPFGEPDLTLNTSGNSARETLGRIAELEDLLAQTRWELRTSRLREELAALGLSRPRQVPAAQKKTGLGGGSPGGSPDRERGGAP
jgi:hypothetical protein